MIEPALCETSLMTFYEAIIIIYKNRIQNKYNRLFLLVTVVAMTLSDCNNTYMRQHIKRIAIMDCPCQTETSMIKLRHVWMG